MTFSPLPPHAAWQHRDSRSGFEVAFFSAADAGMHCTGCATAVRGDERWIIDYAIELDAHWHTHRAQVRCRSGASGHPSEVLLASNGHGRWLIDGQPAPHLDGLIDVDLEASAFTNTFPIHRLALAVGQSAEAPAAWVRAPGLQVERLEQRYTRVTDNGEHARFDYAAPRFDFQSRLVFDRHGLVLEYPGIAVRAA